jgi:lincosamide nucleotidyltransferase B/F
MKMPHPERLMQRLDEIGHSVASTGNCLALIGLGSVGLEFDRLDEYSDLDFFVIVQAGYKQEFMHDLGWLHAVCPLAWSFQNTADGYKVLFEDGIFAEYAVFERDELPSIPFAPGRIVWAAPGVDANIAHPILTLSKDPARTVEWLVGEVLSNLYIGLCRLKRGEKMSALRFVQSYAVDRILELAPQFEAEQAAFTDPFTPERRFEQRFPELAKRLASFCLGYEHTCESARNILEFLEEKIEVNAAIRREILLLLDELPN